ncbi:hypothetical protein BDR04DRAFT_166168 [Suillus decipiens]|nr:hypothetical protein BDR04DRAFT_166168 [Suillus decipiens]
MLYRTQEQMSTLTLVHRPAEHCDVAQCGKLCMNLQTYRMSACRPLAVSRTFYFLSLYCERQFNRSVTHCLMITAVQARDRLTTQNLVLRLLRPALKEPSYSFLGSTSS